MSPIPVDVLLHILDHVDRSDLHTLCQINHLFSQYATNSLYRDLVVADSISVCETLNRYSHLAVKVQRFELCHLTPRRGRPSSHYTIIQMTLPGLRNLQMMTLRGQGEFSWILQQCTFQIHTFICDLTCDDGLVKFLNSQIYISTLELHGMPYWGKTSGGQIIDSGALSKLSKIATNEVWISKLVPGRPLNDIVFFERRLQNSGNMKFLAASTSPLQSLTLSDEMLRDIEDIGHMFPALRSFTLYHENSAINDLTEATQDFACWLKNLISNLKALSRLGLLTQERSFQWSSLEEQAFVGDIAGSHPTLCVVLLESDCMPCWLLRTTWTKLGLAGQSVTLIDWEIPSSKWMQSGKIRN